MIAWAIDLVLALASSGAFSAAPPPPTGEVIVPVRVVASSVAAPEGLDTFEAEHLVDGDPTTAWQPTQGGALGLGQWVRVELDRDYLITRIEVLNGWQKQDGPDDRFCTHGSIMSLDSSGDRGSGFYLDSDRQNRLLTMTPGTLFNKHPAVTRTLTFVVRGVVPGMVAHDSVALSEIRIWGRPADPASVPPASRCLDPMRDEFAEALLEACAKNTQVRPNAECSWFRVLLRACSPDTDKWKYPFPDAAQLATGNVDYRLESQDPDSPIYSATFTRGAGGRWSASNVRCELGKQHRPCGPWFDIPSYREDRDKEMVELEVCKRADGTWMKRELPGPR